MKFCQKWKLPRQVEMDLEQMRTARILVNPLNDKDQILLRYHLVEDNATVVNGLINEEGIFCYCCCL